MAALAAIAVLEQRPGCVLLCYEDVEKPGEWCHRRIAAGWLERELGLAVPELEAAQTRIV